MKINLNILVNLFMRTSVCVDKYAILPPPYVKELIIRYIEEFRCYFVRIIPCEALRRVC